MKVTAYSVEQTRELGALFASKAMPGDIYLLEGDLGTGKTEFVRGFTEKLDRQCTVRSPTFSIINVYATRAFPVYHFDFYRMCDPDELNETGYYEYINGDGVCLIEWGNLFPEVIPQNAVRIKITDVNENVRIIETAKVL
ncbi:MAG TPA: tRNA (adenosine(37)-N6)-threonylcarbamoyltransferase complex ATPase subunit type 1 TsaE [Chitinispirillaceae bacterium]|nr:tRNA (adenosine(37)-N6)-threonylcarbamoyltransferase complex ATPase subunit type 1 TsaE [Chitinispirillaceae bacterium]